MTDSTAPLIDDTALMDALWSLVAERGWQATTLPALAERAGTDLPALRGAVPAKFALLCRHARLVDQAVLADAGLNPGGSPRDRLFDTLMRRVDALQPHRVGLVRFGRELRHDPLLALALAPVLGASMAWMLEAARLQSCGLTGTLRVKGLGAVWIATLRAWEQDESVDLGLTMAALDRALDKAERAARWLKLDRDGDHPAPDAAAPPPPAGTPASPDPID
ncbi:TetR family transcriptional regulator [Roseomonas sp. 18066]|uniref:TetR family transcriptional regulator n=1 Tax=Roseomonas sp. 18066 TaxID=2681412 RepID=UPI0013587A6C|nr:TetR family transcriptional regulator [Roseomonas sp. 18066]